MRGSRVHEEDGDLAWRRSLVWDLPKLRSYCVLEGLEEKGQSGPRGQGEGRAIDGPSCYWLLSPSWS